MMNRALCSCVLILFLSVSVVHAENGPGRKLYRGAVNVVTSPVEFPKQVRAYWIEGAQKTDHILVWIGCGFAWGGVQFLARMGSGFWDVLSFPFEKPDEYKPLMEPEFVFDQWPRNPVSGR